ncbi:acetate--CoA ligase family protein [Acidobacteriota bacterium]
MFDSVEIACKCIAALSDYGHYRGRSGRWTNFVFNWGAQTKPEGLKIIESALSEGRHALLEHEAKNLLKLHGVPVARDRLARSSEEAVEMAAQIATPVALKICSPQILHKSDAGGVKLGLQTDTQIRNAFKESVASAKRFRPNADIRGCIVSPMAEPGIEVIVGTKIDPQFGPVIMFGIGGILVEVLKDVVFRVLPISRGSAKKMLSEIRSAPLLNGVRGQLPVCHEALIDLLMTVSELVESYPRIQEIDLNPAIVRKDGLTVVDARILLKKNNRIDALFRS